MPTLKVTEYSKIARALGKQQGNEDLRPFAGCTEPLACIHEEVSDVSVQAWLNQLRVPTINVELSASADLWTCFAASSESGSKMWTITSTGMGLAATWNARNPTQRLKRGDRLAEINGRPAEGVSDLSNLCSGTDVFTFQRCCPNAQ
eukprot:12239110-Karenia_brevis.AAC.1